MEITLIKNIKTDDSVCHNYLHKKLDMTRTEIEVGKPLRIVYESGMFFAHENVVRVNYVNDETVIIETTKKVWLLEELFDVILRKKEINNEQQQERNFY